MSPVYVIKSNTNFPSFKATLYSSYVPKDLFCPDNIFDDLYFDVLYVFSKLASITYFLLASIPSIYVSK